MSRLRGRHEAAGPMLRAGRRVPRGYGAVLPLSGPPARSSRSRSCSLWPRQPETTSGSESITSGTTEHGVDVRSSRTGSCTSVTAGSSSPGISPGRTGARSGWTGWSPAHRPDRASPPAASPTTSCGGGSPRAITAARTRSGVASRSGDPQPPWASGSSPPPAGRSARSTRRAARWSAAPSVWRMARWVARLGFEVIVHEPAALLGHLSALPQRLARAACPPAAP